jgi:aminopeptidase N
MKLLQFCLFLTVSLLQSQINSKKASYLNSLKYEKSFDLIHTKLAVSFDIPNEELLGEAWLTIKPHFYKTAKVVLDAKAMLVDGVFLNEKNLGFHNDGEQLFIDLDKEYTKEDSIVLRIKYIARPNKVKQKGSAAITDAKGLYFIDPRGVDENKPTQIWTQGETEASSCWFPTIDKPNQKTTQEIFITVPEKFVTLSNGNLVSEELDGKGNRTDYWKMTQKHAPYLFFMGIGEFSIVKDSWRDKEVNYYVEKEYESLAKKIFGKTPKMMEYFSNLLGVDYVWDKYSQIVVRDYVSGAMENTTAVVHGDGAYQSEGDLIDENKWEPIIAHELFHHWFGDLVTTENWSNLTLNESFANYSEYLWLHHEYGKDMADAHMLKDIEGYKKGDHISKHLVRFDYSNKEDMFDAVSYNKGGVVLHMLRNYLGDEAFFLGLKRYLTENKFSAAEVPQLRMVLEEVSGKDLNWFFEQWYYGAGHPRVNVSLDYNLLEKTVSVTLKQGSLDVFYFPLSIDIHEGGKVVTKKVFVDAEEKTFVFSYENDPSWINVNSDHVVLGDFLQNKTLRNYKYQYLHGEHIVDRKEALLELIKNQDNKEVFEIVVGAFNDEFRDIRIIALENIDLSYKHSKRGVIKSIENIARTDKDNFVKAAAIKVLGKLVYFDYQSDFERAFESESNAVKGNALEALYYLNDTLAVEKAKELSSDVKKTIAFPLAKIYISQREVSEMEFVASYVLKGLYLVNDKATNKLFQTAFKWISKSDNEKAYKNLVSDLVEKGIRYKKYNFHLSSIKMLREMVYEQEKSKHKNKRELINIVKVGMEQLID